MAGVRLKPLTVCLTGQFSVVQENVELDGFDGEKARELFTLLVLAGDSGARFEQLTADLWPNDAVLPESTEDRHSKLRACLHRMLKGRPNPKKKVQRFLEEGRLQSPYKSIRSLYLANVSVDVLELEKLYIEGSIPALKTAVEMFRGELLPGSKVERIRQKRSELIQKHLSALDRLILDARNAGNTIDAVSYLNRRIQCHPSMREQYTGQLMDVLIQAGQENEARNVYHATLGPRIAPDAALSARIAGLKRSDLRERLPDPPQSAPRASKHLTQLVGRTSELRDLMALPDTMRFVTIQGPPGVGKTSLAKSYSASVSVLYNGKVVFVDLTVSRTSCDVERRILEAFEGPKQPTAPFGPAIAELIGKNRLLLILDNCEHATKACAEAVEAIIAASPGVRIVATSLTAIRPRCGEHIIKLQPLDLPVQIGTRQDLREALVIAKKNEAVALFVREVSLLRVGFQLTEENLGVVVNLVRALGGLPLAIRLAATASMTCSPKQMLERLNREGTAYLRDDGLSLPERHRALHAVLSVAFELLSDEEKSLAICLGALTSSWTLEAAAAVCGIETAEPLLKRLVEASIVEFYDAEGETRYYLLQTMQIWLRERLLDSGSADLARRRHAQYYRDRAIDIDPKLKGPDQTTWLRRARLEVDNVRSATEWCRRSDEVELGMTLASNWWRVWSMTDDLKYGYQVITDFIDADSGKAPLLTRSRALSCAAILAMQTLDFSNARRCFNDALAINDACKNTVGTASVYANLGALERQCHNFEAAEANLLKMVSLYSTIPDIQFPSNAYIMLAENASSALWLDKALHYCNLALDLFRQAGDKHNVAVTMQSLSETHYNLGQMEQALIELEIALDISVELENWRLIGECYYYLMRLAVGCGAWNAAAILDALHAPLMRGKNLPRQSGDWPTQKAIHEAVLGSIEDSRYRRYLEEYANADDELVVTLMKSICEQLRDMVVVVKPPPVLNL